MPKRKNKIYTNDAGIKIIFPNSIKIPKCKKSQIESTLLKIGTGLGREHILTGGDLKGYSAIHLNHKERIVFDYLNPTTVKVKSYDPNHSYN